MFKDLIFMCALAGLVISQDLDLSPQQKEAIYEETCTKKQDCSDCIQTPECKWCKDAVFGGKRCIFNVTKSGCEKIENPSSSQLETDAKSHSVTADPSALTSSKATGKLRRGQKINITMTYTDEKNRPLDLYILMDLSCTMLPHKETVGKLANVLVKNLQNLTSDLKIGFGSFVDKPVGPFVLSRPADKNTVQNCNGIDLKYTVPHLFKNHLSLTHNISEFIRTVDGATILTNVDPPEGGLDALMQAISCTNDIGWRSEQRTRRLIVVSTDGPFHIAGDGKLGGIIIPNDGYCHLNAAGEYTQAAYYDYPSISQIKSRIEDQNIYVIFAVTEGQVRIYEKLAQEIGDLSAVQSIDGGASIAEAIKTEYEKVVNKVSFRDPSSDILGVTYYAKCPGSLVYEKRGDCGNLTPGAKVTFEVELELKKCPSDRDLWKTNVEIAPYQSAGQSHLLNITLDLLCGCDCELVDSQTKIGQAKCAENGYLQCGICKCNPGFGGPTCNCSVAFGESVDQELCRDSNFRICGNRGTCRCGECQCDSGYGGKFCECSYDCLATSSDKGVCNSELGQGTCGCSGSGSRCECTEGFSGSRCECPLNDNGCRDPGSPDKVCNNFGNCKCGACTCNEKDGYHGKFCQEQHSKLQGSCSPDLVSEIASCVKCLIVDNPTVPEQDKLKKCQAPCKSVHPDYLSTIDEEKESECRGAVLDGSECNVLFIIGDRDVISGKVRVRAEKAARVQNCVSPAPILPVILGVIGAIVLIGILLLLIWKVVTYVHDRKEFQRFENEKKNAAWNLNQNPLYKATVTEFQNPTFGTDMD